MPEGNCSFRFTSHDEANAEIESGFLRTLLQVNAVIRVGNIQAGFPVAEQDSAVWRFIGVPRFLQTDNSVN